MLLHHSKGRPLLKRRLIIKCAVIHPAAFLDVQFSAAAFFVSFYGPKITAGYGAAKIIAAALIVFYKFLNVQ